MNPAASRVWSDTRWHVRRQGFSGVRILHLHECSGTITQIAKGELHKPQVIQTVRLLMSSGCLEPCDGESIFAMGFKL